MQSVATFLIFHTPFEEKEFILKKFHKTKEMFQDYIVNTWMSLSEKQYFDWIYDVFEYWNEDIFISFSYKKNFDANIFFPSVVVNYDLNIFKFENQNIESFLNDNIWFFSNVFGTDFFLDYDKKYNLDDRVKWKDLNFEDLKKFNLEDKYAYENKKNIDNLLYLHYQLLKNIYNVDNSIISITKLVNKQINFSNHSELFKTRNDILKRNLLLTQEKMYNHIISFLQLFNN